MTKHMRASFGSTFEMMEQLNALMAAENTSGDIALLGQGEGVSPLSLLNALMQQGGQISRQRAQDSRKNGVFIARDSFDSYETKFMSRLGYDALKVDKWFDANTLRFPEDFDWWKQAVGYEA